QRLAKLSPNLMIGDIVKYRKFPRGYGYGIVSSVGFPNKLEIVNELGEFDEEIIHQGWSYYDRQMVAKPLDERTWSSANGKFNIKAQLVAVEGEQLTLRKNTGDSIQTSVSKLSKIDQSYVKRVRARLNVRNDGQLERDRQSYSDELRKLLARRAEIVARVSANIAAANDASKMKSIRLHTRPVNLNPDQLRPFGMGRDTFSYSFPLRVPEHANIQQICYAKKSGLVALVASSPFRGKPTLAVVDPVSQRVVTNIDSDDVGPDGQTIAVSPSGKTIIIYSGERLENNLELWRNENEKLVRKSTVNYESNRVPQGFLFDDSSGVVLSSEGNLVFFDVENRIIPTHMIAKNGLGVNRRIQISDNHQYVFFFDLAAQSLHIIDAATKTCIGGVAIANSTKIPTGWFQVNNDGKSATYIENDRLTIYNLATGKPFAEKKLPNTLISFKGHRNGLHVVSPDLVVLGDRRLYDFRLQTEIGSVDYRFSRKTEDFADLTRLTGEIDRGITSRQSGTGGFGQLLGTSMPTSIEQFRNRGGRYNQVTAKITSERLPVDAMIEHANSLSEADVVEFDRGSKVQLQFKLDSKAASMEERLRSKIERIMSEGGIQIVNRSDFVLELNYAEQEPETRSYKIIGDSKPRTRKVTLTPKTCSARLSYQDQPIWGQNESAGFGRPFDENDLDEKIRKARNLNPNKLMEFECPTKIRVVEPAKMRKFKWQGS
ncbi:MAG: SHD1 domain-containing protein, partial [Planctomycetota bacterium]